LSVLENMSWPDTGMKKRGPKSLLTKKLQAAICEILSNANTISTACAACGIGEKTYFRWCEKHPTFLTATREARARAKIQLVDIIRNAAKTNAFHAHWLLERSWPNEYARTERVEQIGEKADEKALSCNIFYDLGGHTLAELTDFPVEGDSPEVTEQKQARLTALGSTPAPSGSTPSETISDAPPPQSGAQTSNGTYTPRMERQRQMKERFGDVETDITKVKGGE
jgi:hypothetical protein